jgi:peptide chain release factor subunit 3
MQILDIPEGKKGIMASGYTCMMHFHTLIDEISIDVIAEIDKKTKTEKKVKFLRSQTRAKVIIKSSKVNCGEKFEKFPTLGRFTLRDEGK